MVVYAVTLDCVRHASLLHQIFDYTPDCRAYINKFIIAIPPKPFQVTACRSVAVEEKAMYIN
jgi:hypothetical protein